ncbi:hypothetical protein SP5_076_00550 [Sphingomonas parapaucimobilis NBRC 15100]|uniref:Uncharacterized protein n=1 Tax=Sphingomonas parapaucimobilis NBRC 15100 TaxID=1219049 RepID=A0A0A1WA71_9SPHN|nr:hypothetical protein SP5_076_00550 [Sphingomonas parapaucimobilis NBRC 15100]
MRRSRTWMIVIPLGLIACPAMASQNERDMSNDCFDVAAPMAEATPCFEPGRHTRPHHARPRHARHGGNATGLAPTKSDTAGSDGRANPSQ